jgi:hypothetical protein
MIFTDQVKNIMFTSQALVVTPNDSADLSAPGTLFLDENGTEGMVTVTLLDGGTVKLSLTKAICFATTCIVKRVFATGTTAVNIYINTISQ